MIPLGILNFARSWWKAALGIVLGALLCWPVASCQGRKDGRAQMQLAVERANAKALEQSRRADAIAANQRLTDTIAVNQQERTLRDAIASTPDSAPDAARIALGCERLRRANRGRSADLPAVCRSGGGGQARPAG